MEPKFLGDSVLQNFTNANHISNSDEILDMFSKYDIYYGQKLAENKYVVRKSILSCSMGTKFSRLNMPCDHGIVPPVAVTSDSAVNANIHPFGLCKCRTDRATGSNCVCSPALTTDWLQGDSVVKIWNEKAQRYEDAVKDTAVLVCQYGGIIKVSQVPKKTPEKKAEILLCQHGNKIAIVDTLHPKGPAVIDESKVFGNISEDGIEFVVSSVNSSVDSSVDSNKRSGPLDVLKEMGPEDSVERQQTASGYVLDGVDGARDNIPLPDNALTELAEQYLKAGGDYAGIVIGTIWVSGVAPDAPQKEQEKLKKLGEIGENEKIGKMVFDEKDEWFKKLLEYSHIFAENFIVDWKAYMEANPILSGKVGDVVIPIGYSLKNNQKKKISMEISMVIENGSGYTGYEFLHGTDQNVGGFQINGTVSKNKKGDVTYNLNYKWNDIINPEVERYSDDAQRNGIANKYFKPKNYIIVISWNDKSKIKANPGFLNGNSGWLKNWSSDWSKKLSKRYGYLYRNSDGEQSQPQFGGLNWAGRLEQIKGMYPDYYN